MQRGSGTQLKRWTTGLLTGSALAVLSPAQVDGQTATGSQPVIDTIVVVRNDVFNPEQAQSSAFFRVMNKLHITTHEWVIRKELLFRQGQPYDSARVEESERILRSRQIFRELSIDTTRLDGRFAVVVRTQDGWSTKPKFQFSVASDGNWTGTFGINEINLLGTGNQVYAAYVREVDRDGLNLSAKFNRILGTNIDAGGNYAGLSDGRNGNWLAGYPFRALETRGSLQYDGLAANQRILQFRVPNAETLDTTIFRRTAFINNLTGGLATSRSPERYVRVVGTAGIRREEYVLDSNAGDVPDTVTATIGAYFEFNRAKFQDVRRFNGFGDENINLSTTARLTLNFAPELFGWERAGIAPWVGVTGAKVIGKGFIWGAVDANGQFDEAGLDSGRVVMNLAFGYKFHPRHATAFQVQAGLLDDPAPGQEFNLGFNAPPRSWEPHSFVGDRELWASFEHRWFVWDRLLNLFGVGFAGFLDYGGAWYNGEQRSRFGGNVGVGLRVGSALGTVPITGRTDLGYRFGDDVTGSRWVLSIGTGFVFPRRTIPVISYKAQPPP